MDELPKPGLRTILRHCTSRGVTVECGDDTIVFPRISALANVIHDHIVHTVY